MSKKAEMNRNQTPNLGQSLSLDCIPADLPLIFLTNTHYNLVRQCAGRRDGSTRVLVSIGGQSTGKRGLVHIVYNK